MSIDAFGKFLVGVARSMIYFISREVTLAYQSIPGVIFL